MAIAEVTPTNAEEIVLVVPNAIAGEVGSSLPDVLCKIIRNMADLGYWPLSFGEGDDTHATLWFMREPEIAQQQAEYFIEQQGEV